MDRVDLDQGLINISQQILAVSYEPYTDTPKADSERTIVLDETTRLLLVEWKARQDEERRALSGQGKWIETGRIFTTEEDGSTYHPEWISRRFRRLAKDAGLPPIRLHEAAAIVPRNGHKRGLRLVKDGDQSSA